MIDVIIRCLKIWVFVYLIAWVMCELGQENMARIMKPIGVLIIFSILLPTFSRMGRDVEEVRADIRSASEVIETVNGVKESASGVVRPEGILSKIIHFGEKPTLLKTKLVFPASGANSKSITQIFKGTDHHGVDIAVNTGTPIVASLDGVVSFVGLDPKIYGNYIIIDHDEGFQTLYAHCSELKVKKSDRVFYSDTIALSGGEKGAKGAGNSEGPHLHFELRFTGKAIDPIPYFSK